MSLHQDFLERLSPLNRYAMAVGLYLVALALRLVLLPVQSGLAFVTFFPAVGLAFYACGILPGWLTTVLSTLTAFYYFTPPYSGFVPGALLAPGPVGLIGAATFLAAAWIMSEIVRQLRMTAVELRAACDSAEMSERRYQAMLEDQVRLAAENADLFDNAPCGYHSLGTDGKYLRINNTELNWLGRTREEVIGKLGPLDSYTAEGKAEFQQRFEQFKAQGVINDATYDLLSTTGDIRRVTINATAIRDAAGKVVASRTVMHDITEVERIRSELRHLAREQQAMLDNELVGIVKLRGRQLVWLNKAMHRIFGYEDGEMIGRSSRILYPDDASFHAIGRAAYPTLRSGEAFRTQWEMARKDTRRIWVDTSGTLLDGERRESLWMILDITAMKKHEARLEQLASFDVLTGTLDRGLLRDLLGQAIARARRAGSLMAVLYIDLDEFKPINDSFGHQAGDQVLKVLADRLMDAVRRTDRVVRAGGDEFVVLLEEIDDVPTAARVADKVLRAFAEAITLVDGAIVRVGASIGVAIFPDDAEEIDRLLLCADKAMYKSKSDGKNRCTLYRDCGLAATTMPWIDIGLVHEIGIAEVDQQHAKLVRLANALNEAVKAQRPAPIVGRLFNELVQYLKFHFATEERMMEAQRYPDREIHARIHADLLDDVAHIRTHLEHGAELVALQAIKDWLIHHVRATDRPMGEHLTGGIEGA